MSKYLSVEKVQIYLLIVGFEEVPDAAIRQADQRERRRILHWAGAIIYRASDNDDVKIPRLPKSMKPYYTRHGFPARPATAPI